MTDTEKKTKGGSRPGAGRKPAFVNSDKFREQLVSACEKKAEETGRTVADELLEIAYSDDKRTKMPALRLIFEKVVTEVREVESGSTMWGGPLKFDPEKKDEFFAAVKILQEAGALPAGGIFLPEERPNPAKVMSLKTGGGK